MIAIGIATTMHGCRQPDRFNWRTGTHPWRADNYSEEEGELVDDAKQVITMGTGKFIKIEHQTNDRAKTHQ